MSTHTMHRFPALLGLVVILTLALTAGGVPITAQRMPASAQRMPASAQPIEASHMGVAHSPQDVKSVKQSGGATYSLARHGLRFVSLNGIGLSHLSSDRRSLVAGSPLSPDTALVLSVDDLMTRVSIATDGSQGNAASRRPDLTADGRFAVYDSCASNLVAGDTNSKCDVFIYDRQTGETERVSVSGDGTQGDGDSVAASVSNDGRFVAFESNAANLVPDDTNNKSDIFIRDRLGRNTQRLSVDSQGTQSNGNSNSATVSFDGRFVVFVSYASNLTPGDNNAHSDVFLHDRQTGRTELVGPSMGWGGLGGIFPEPASISNDGRFVVYTNLNNCSPDPDVPCRYAHVVLVDRQGQLIGSIHEPVDPDYGSSGAVISGDGLFVAFGSSYPNLVVSDTNSRYDVFVYSRQTGNVERISISSEGTQGNGSSSYPSISADGRYVTFVSEASNLVSGDTNGALDVFIHDRQTHQTERVSLASDGSQGNGRSSAPSLSPGGHEVAFESDASNLVPGDTNGTTDIFVHDRDAATYTISGRVTDASGAGIPGVTVWAGFPRATTTNAYGYYTFTGLPAGTYSIRPDKDPYAFSPASLPITVPPDATGVDFQAVAITKIQVNQALGSTTNYVAGKDTVIQVVMSDYVSYDSAHQQVVVKRDGAYVTTLKPLKPAFPTQTLNFWGKMEDCENWQQGSYTFEATVNGATRAVSDLTFQNRGDLTIRVVPVETKAGTPKFDWGQMQRFIESVYPLKQDGITWRLWGPLDATDLDLEYDDARGKLTLENRLKALQPPGCDVAPGSDCPRILGIIHYDSEVGKGWTRTARVAVAADVPEIQTVIAHEIGHDIGYTATNDQYSGLGDVYSGGMFQCSINPAPKSYVGTDGRDGLAGKSCIYSSAVAWVPSATAPNASGSTVLGAGDNHDYPCEVGGRGALGNKLSFMGHGESQDNFWVTPDAYDYLFNQLAEPLAQAAVTVNAVGRVAVVSGWIGRDGSASLRPAYYVTASDPASTTGAYGIEVLDAQGQLLASQGFDVSFVSLSDPPQDTNDAPFRVAVRLPEGAQRVQVKHGATVLAEMIISAHAPTLSLTYPSGGQTWAATGTYTIRWQGDDVDGDTLHYTVLCRQGTGDWIVLGADLTANELTVDAAGLPGGTAAQVQVLATDGINTTAVESAPFTVGRKPPEAFIAYPADGASFMPGVSLFLQGVAYDLEDGTLPDSAYRWSSDKDGDLGTGASNLVTLSSGPHVITLTVMDSDGNTAVKTIRLSAGYQQFLPTLLRSR